MKPIGRVNFNTMLMAFLSLFVGCEKEKEDTGACDAGSMGCEVDPVGGSTVDDGKQPTSPQAPASPPSVVDADGGGDDGSDDDGSDDDSGDDGVPAPDAPAIAITSPTAGTEGRTLTVEGSCETAAGAVELTGDLTVSPTETECVAGMFSATVVLIAPFGDKSVVATQVRDGISGTSQRTFRHIYCADDNLNPLSAGFNGSGTLNDPYMICHSGHLRDVEDDMSAHYALAQDIAMNPSVSFAPIGLDTDFEPNSVPFSGHLDGRNFKIVDLYQYRDATNAGLFWQLDGATIESLTFYSAYVDGKVQSGLLAGYAKDSTITGVRATAASESETYVESRLNIVGGLVGTSESSTFRNVHFDGWVLGTSIVGGIVGEVLGVTTEIETCSTSGRILAVTGAGGVAYGATATARLFVTDCVSSMTFERYDSSPLSEVGGLVHTMSRDSTIFRSAYTGSVSDGVGQKFGFGGLAYYMARETTITDSYVSGSISITGEIGGAVHSMHELARLERVHVAGPIESSQSLAGGLVFLLPSTSTSNVNNFFNQSASPGIDAIYSDEGGSPASHAGYSGLTATQMAQDSSFTLWDFGGVWNLDNGTYPRLNPY